jgi:hypothetical protein
MHPRLAEYGHVFRAIRERWWFKVAGIVWVVLAAYDLVLSQFVPEHYAKKAPKAWEVVLAGGLITWWGWLLILAAIMVVASLEYAVRLKRSHRADTVHAQPMIALSKRIPVIDLFKEIWKKPVGADERVQKIKELATAIRQEGLLGELALFGKPRRYKTPNLIQLEPLNSIPKEHWENFEICWLDTISSDNRGNPLMVKQESFDCYSYTHRVDLNKYSGYADIHIEREGGMRLLRAQQESHDKPPTLHDYFKNDFSNLLRVNNTLEIKSNDGKATLNIEWCVYMDFAANTQFISYYLPHSSETYEASMSLSEAHKNILEYTKKNLEIGGKHPADPATTYSRTMTFSGRVYLYHEDDLSLKQNWIHCCIV